MSEDDDTAVTLGEGRPVEGAPLARVSARLMWGIERSTIREREGDTVVRTPDGPRELDSLLDAVDQTYFATRREFETAVRDPVGTGPVPTAGDGSDTDSEQGVGSGTDPATDGAGSETDESGADP